MSYNVYLAEDEYMLREYVKSNTIWKTGPYVLCGDASNGEDAWQDIQNAPVDILVTDIKMPFMDGLELSRLVRENRPEIKIIILSGYDDFSYAKQALALGVTDYLLKPLKPDDLLKTMARTAALIDKEKQQKRSPDPAGACKRVFGDKPPQVSGPALQRLSFRAADRP